jgi:hypothetical protein
VTLKKNLAGSGVIAALLLCGATAQAVPVIYDFTGTGTVCTYNPATGGCALTYSGGFTGTVSIDVLTNDLSSLSSYITNGSTQAQAASGWANGFLFNSWLVSLRELRLRELRNRGPSQRSPARAAVAMALKALGNSASSSTDR